MFYSEHNVYSLLEKYVSFLKLFVFFNNQFQISLNLDIMKKVSYCFCGLLHREERHKIYTEIFATCRKNTLAYFDTLQLSSCIHFINIQAYIDL